MGSMQASLLHPSYIERARFTYEEVVGLRDLREIDNKNRKNLN